MSGGGGGEALPELLQVLQGEHGPGPLSGVRNYEGTFLISHISRYSGRPRGNCTGLEDDTSDNLEKVWCFLENIRDPTNPQSGCYQDVKWSHRDGRFWSSLACFESPDIEGGIKRKINDSRDESFPLSADKIKQNLMNIKQKLSTTTSTIQKIPIPIIQPLADDEFSSILNTIFKSAHRA